jgi:N-methylhydantoinase B
MDPVMLEVMRNEFLGITEEMNITMQRTMRSVAGKETNDFSSCLLDANGTVVAQSVPYGLSVFVQGVPHVIEKFRGRFEPGDVLLCNDPYRGMSHLPDILVVAPIFAQGKLVGFAATFQHHTDIGGRFPGGFGTQSRELYEEGLQLPIVHFYRAGEPELSVHDIIRANVRVPGDVLGDLEANAAACRRGARGLSGLIEKYDLETVSRCCDHLVDLSEQKMVDLIDSIPPGDYQARGTFDDGDTVSFEIVLTLRIGEGVFEVDLTGTSQQSETAWNLPPGFAMAAVIPALLGLLGDSELVVNGGLTRPVRLIAPPGTIVNPIFPAAVSSRAQALHRLRELTLDALRLAVPAGIPAASEGGPTTMVYTYKQQDVPPDDGGVMTDIWLGGWGARAAADGIDGVGSFAMQGFQTASAEVIETQAPVSVEGFGFVTDTGGAGQFRGTVSIFRRLRFLRDGQLMIRTSRVSGGGQGIDGGEEGGMFSASLTRNGATTSLPRHSSLVFDILADDVVEHVMPGGGGCGDPLHRDPILVLDDVIDEKVSIAAASATYGVAIDTAPWRVDKMKTAELRRNAR